MRKIDWENRLSEEDIAFLRQTGIMGIEERIAGHQARFKADVPDPEIPDDTTTTSALDPTARATTPAETGDGPLRVDPTEGGVSTEQHGEFDDDYDKWKVPELEDEVEARNAMADTSEVSVTGTGKDGAVRKPDLIAALRAWDRENPDALKD